MHSSKSRNTSLHSFPVNHPFLHALALSSVHRLNCSGACSRAPPCMQPFPKDRKCKLIGQLSEGECVSAGIAERLQRTRRPPKRPYSLPDIPKPKPKKQASRSTHHNLQHRHADRLLRQDSGSTSSEQFAQPRQHHTQYSQHHQQHHHQQRKASLPGRASSDAAAVAKKANRGRLKGRCVVEDVGCIRAAAYQGEAFMQARVEVLQQQGVVQGNQAPADHDTGQQVSTQTYVAALVISPCLPNNDLYAAVFCSVCSTAQLVNRSAYKLMSLPWSSAHVCQTMIHVQLCTVLKLFSIPKCQF